MIYRASLAVAALMFAVLMARWFERGEYVDPVRRRRHCAAPPSGDDGQLAIVEAAGSPDPTRSHFDAQDFMESGTLGKLTEDGWLNRALPPAGLVASPLRAIAMVPMEWRRRSFATGPRWELSFLED